MYENTCRTCSTIIFQPIISLRRFQPRALPYRYLRLTLSCGRLIDTAQGYPNSEPQVGEAIAQSGIPRSEIFIMTKLHPKYLGYDSTLAAIEMSLKALQTDYIDLFLIHSKHCDDFLLVCQEGSIIVLFLQLISYLCAKARQSLKV